jgi:hypothetical protein
LIFFVSCYRLVMNCIVLHVSVGVIFCYVREWPFIWPFLHLEHVSTALQWDSLVLCKHVNIQHAVHKYWCLFPWAKAAGVCTSAEVESEWSCTSFPSVGLHGTQRDGFTFLLYHIPALHVKCKKSRDHGRFGFLIFQTICVYSKSMRKRK